MTGRRLLDCFHMQGPDNVGYAPEDYGRQLTESVHTPAPRPAPTSTPAPASNTAELVALRAEIRRLSESVAAQTAEAESERRWDRICKGAKGDGFKAMPIASSVAPFLGSLSFKQSPEDVAEYPFTLDDKKAERLNPAINFKDYELHHDLKFLMTCLRRSGDLVTNNFWPPAFPKTYRLLVRDGRRELARLIANEAAKDVRRPALEAA